MDGLVERLLGDPKLGPLVAHRHRVDARPAVWSEPEQPLPAALREAFAATGIDRLYSHQASGIDLARQGHDVLAVTPTASGKTLLFASCVFESFLADPESRALFLYPTKALAQDQLAGLRDLAGSLGALGAPRLDIYDGDTTPTRRRKIKANPPNILLTNPDMLHLGLLGHHADWERFFRRLRWVVLDELHVYRGLFGSHVHHILARLQRVCSHYGANPRFVAASATIGNPAEFAETLVGRPFAVVSDSGAPRAALDVAFLNPVGVSPYTVAVRLVAEAVRHGSRTIAFTKARRTTELLHTWLVRQEPQLAGKVAPYRAGYLPEERRALEARLFSGELSAVLSTSALELGIDVGGLDVCVLVGYPGSLISSWQRIGRVGRQAREGVVLLVAMPDALDQYVVRHPDMFFGRQFEKAVLDPWNPFVAGKHLVCAAAERPLERTELARWGEKGQQVVDGMVQDSRLVQDAEGSRWFSFRRRPHRDVSPRSVGQPFTIVERGSGRTLGTIDAGRVYRECHPGAIYLHGGRSYLVHRLDTERHRVVAAAARVDYYTVVLGDKETEILERLDSRRIGPFPIGLGRLKVTVRIREYQKRRLYGGEPISTHPLDVPPMIYETVGFWIELPAGMPAAFTERDLHFMGGIHATEHAIIGLFPLLAIADRGDVGGISYTGHPQLGAPAVFIYDGMAGGAGLAEQGFADLESMLGRTLGLLNDCPCEDGCPCCIQSPRCGNGNKPLDKEAAKLVLESLCGVVTLQSLGVEPSPDRSAEPLPTYRDVAPPTPAHSTGATRQGMRRAGNIEPGTEPTGWVERPIEAVEGGGAHQGALIAGPDDSRDHVLVLDVETQRSAEDVGGWANTSRMGLALAVVYDRRQDVYRTYYESDVHKLLLDLVMADRVVGFNIDRFDLHVLTGYTDQDLKRIRTLDLLSEITRRLGFRVSLSHLAEINLGQAKAGGGLQSLEWWKQGRIDLIERYCRMDVEVTLRLYQLGREQGYLLYRDHSDRAVRVPVGW